MVESRKLWVFRVSGGAPFQIKVKGNPIMKHDGGAEDLLKALCSEDQAQDLIQEMESRGCKVLAHCATESKEQKKERQNVVQILGDGKVFPCQRCPQCSWFDPHIESLCGAGKAFSQPGWDKEAVRAALQQKKFKEDLDYCPLNTDDT